MKTRGRAAPSPAEMGAVDIGCKAWVTAKGVQLSKSNKLRANGSPPARPQRRNGCEAHQDGWAMHAVGAGVVRSWGKMHIDPPAASLCWASILLNPFITL